MRKVKLGAIQPAGLPVQATCNFYSPEYTADPDHVYQYNILGQAEVSFRLLEKAGEMGLDAVTTSEDLCSLGHYMIDTSDRNIFPALAQKSAAMVQERLSALAKKYRMNIIGCYMKPLNGKVYNTATVFNRNGEIAGEYCKTHLPPDEIWQTAPGETADVIELDFGRIGVEICYDMMFPALSEVLSLKGAEVVFHPTAGYGWYDAIGEATLRTRANDGSFYLVTAKNYRYQAAGHSSVIDYWGQVLADAGFYADAVVAHEVDLDIPKTQPQWHYQTGMSGKAEMRERMRGERRPDLYAPVCADQAQPAAVPSPTRQEEIRRKIMQGIYHW